mmetsp:Transcript_23941/g.66474  ORF Transcript_23941/g.66474 Transcript_23941/m.66474 type:complete len:215 (-) Transcript_23941:78-722(-)
MSRSLVSSSFCLRSSFTVDSSPRPRPAPCSTSRVRLAISSLSCWIVSLALASFSWLASTIFHAFSISFFRAWIVLWSSSLSLRAVWTFAAFATISALSSRHFLMRRFSLSWDFFRARWIFSYSTRNLSRLWSPTSSSRTCWKSFSSCSKAVCSTPKASGFASSAIVPDTYSKEGGKSLSLVCRAGMLRCPPGLQVQDAPHMHMRAGRRGGVEMG